jgi:hypothetical protein
MLDPDVFSLAYQFSGNYVIKLKFPVQGLIQHDIEIPET